MAIKVTYNGMSTGKPGVYSKTTVNLSGGFPLAPAGVVGIVGEADGGEPGSTAVMKETFFSPEQFSQAVETYKSGPIVDALKILFAPAADARIPNGAQKVYVYKTNASTKASATLPSSYGTVESLNYGVSENLINFDVDSAQSESLWTSGNLNILVDGDAASTLRARVNGGAQQSVTVAANALVSAFTTDVAALTGFTASGGVDRAVISAVREGDAATLALATSGNVVTITISSTWEVTPTVGDTLQIRSASVIAGGGNENRGTYLITAVTSSTITAVKLSDPSVACAAVLATDITAGESGRFLAFSPTVMTQDATTSAGTGGANEIYDGGGAIPLEEIIFGGTDRGILDADLVSDGSTLALAVSGTTGTFTISSAFAAMPTAGDQLWIRPGSPLVGGSLQNVGAWRVSSATATTIVATKISGSPVAVGAADIAAVTDLQAFKGIVSSSAAGIVNTSSAEAKVLVSINRQSDNLQEDSDPLGGNVAMTVGYFGTTATMTITSTRLTTSVVAGSGANLDLRLSDFATISDLATYIDSQTGYSASVANALYGQMSPGVLDRVAAVGIASGVDGDEPGRIMKSSSEVQDFFDDSVMVSLDRDSFVGLPTATSARVYLTGGAKGGTTAASVTAGIDAMQKVRINSLVPLFSRDASDDVLDELTEASSTYQVDAVNAALRTHVLLMSNTKNRSERNGYASYKGSYSDSKAASNDLASERVSMCIQDVKILKTDGTLDWVGPWGMACVAAGMQAGAPVGEPMTFKFANISGVRHEEFDPATQADDAIDNGLLFADEPESGGFRMVVGNTTYGKDANFVFNRISVLYAADSYAYNLRQQLEAIFVGVSAAVADATAVKNVVLKFSERARNAGWIVGDDTNEGLGFKNLIVRLDGNVMSVDITITPAQGIDFILPSIVLDNIRASA